MSRNEQDSRRGPRRKRDTAQYEWNDSDGAGWLLGLCIGLAMAGGACRVGLTRDGGALALGVYLGEEYGTEYVKPDEDLGTAVREIALAWKVNIPVWDDEAGVWRLR